jgi:hypothetical protein
MELENMVCSLDLARELCDLHMIQNGVFSWIKETSEENYYLYPSAICEAKRAAYSGISIISAFTFPELIQKIPRVYNNERWSLEMVRGNEHLFCFRYGDHPVQYAPTEACAVAKMLIHLLKNKLLKLDKV